MPPRPTATVGVISDTHGDLHPGVARAFDGVDLIVHAGDIGGPGVLLELEAVAPVVAVRGNTDSGPWASALPVQASFLAGDVPGVVVHDLAWAGAIGGVAIVISGHTHRPSIDRRRGVLYVNPGSASQSRARGVGESVALIVVDAEHASATIVRL